MANERARILIHTIWGIRNRRMTTDVLRFNVGAGMPTPSRTIDLPEVIALFDEYGREAVQLAADTVDEEWAKGLAEEDVELPQELRDVWQRSFDH